MDQTPVVKGERRRKRIALLLLMLAFLVGVGSLAFFHIKTARAIEKHVQTLKAAGEPVTLEEVTKEYRSLKAEENGAGAYAHAFGLMTNVALLGERKATEIKVDATKVLDGNRETYEQVHRENEAFYAAMQDATAKFRYTTYPLKFEEGFAMLVKHLKQLADAFRLIELDALWAAEQKDAERLFRDLEMMLVLANSLEHEPIMLSVLVRLRGITMAARLTQLIVQSEKLSDAQFERLRALWNFSPVREHFVRSLALERWVVRDLFTKSSSHFLSLVQEEDGPVNQLIWQFYKISGGAKADELSHMEKVRELQAVMLQPASFEQYQSVQSFVGNLDKERLEGVSKVQLVSRLVLPAIYRASERVIRAEATLQMVMLGLDVAENLKRTGKYPGTLQGLGGTTNPVSRMDPFSGEELIYIVDEEGAVIYSVGYNGRDDRGETLEKAKVDDFGLHVGRPN